jgi:hypothetical protein
MISPMRTLLLSLLIPAAAFCADQLSVSTLLAPAPPPSQRLWKASLATMALANAFDVHSSWGKHELNSTLAGPGGQFGKQGALIKLGLQSGLLGAEYLITRGHPTRKVYRALSVFNFGAAAVTGAVASHNYTIARR